MGAIIYPLNQILPKALDGMPYNLFLCLLKSHVYLSLTFCTFEREEKVYNIQLVYSKSKMKKRHTKWWIIGLIYPWYGLSLMWMNQRELFYDFSLGMWSDPMRCDGAVVCCISNSLLLLWKMVPASGFKLLKKMKEGSFVIFFVCVCVVGRWVRRMSHLVKNDTRYAFMCFW